MASGIYFIHYLRRWQENNNDVFLINASEKGLGKSTLSIHLARDYIKRFGFICPHCGNEFYKNLYKIEKVGNSYRFFIPESIKTNQVRIKCPEHYELDIKSGIKKKTSGCGETFVWSERKRIKWSAAKFIAYDNGEARTKILSMPRYSPLIFDEAMNFMCLTDDTLIKMPRDIKKYKLGVPIKDLIGKENFYVYSYNINEKKLELSKCKGCYYINDDHVYEVTFSNGEKIKCTAEHKFVTKTGEIKKLKDLVWFKEGKSKHHVHKRKNEQPKGEIRIREVNGWSIISEYADRMIIFSEQFNWARNSIKVNFITNKRIQESRFIYQEINGEIPKDFVVHHIDENKMNNNIENLEGLTLSKHSSITIKSMGCPHKISNPKGKEYATYGFNHSESGKKSSGGHGAYIKEVKYLGKKPVYSLVEVSKNHNYFANNILVMNSAMDHNKVESKEMKKLITVVRPRRLFMIANIPELMWVDSKYRDIFAHFWIYAIEKGHAFIFEKNKAVTKDKWGLKYLEKHMGVVKYFTNTEKIKRNIKKHPCYFDSLTWAELPEKVYDDYEYVRNSRNLQRQVEEMELSNLDVGKIMAWNLLNEWDRIQLEVNKSKGNKMTYNILRHEILINPITRKPISSETTVRNWVIGMDQYIKTKGQNAGVFAPKGF